MKKFKEYIFESRPKLIKMLLKKNHEKWTVKNIETGKIYYIKMNQHDPESNINAFLHSIHSYDHGFYKKTYQKPDIKKMIKELNDNNELILWVPENREQIIQSTWSYNIS